MNYFKYIKKPVIIQIVFSFFYTMSIAIIPYLHKLLFDTVVDGKYETLSVLIGYYFVAIAASAILQYISQTHEWETEKAFNISIKKIIFGSFLSYKRPKFLEKDVGEYISTIDNNVSDLENLRVEGFIDIIKSVNMLLVYTAALICFVDLRITFVIMSASLITAFVPKLIAKKLSEKKQRYLTYLGEYINYTTDFLQGHASLDVKSKEKIVQENYKYLLRAEEAQLEFGKFKTLANIVNGIVMNLISLSAFIMVGYLLIKGEITVGTGVATFSYIESFIYPIRYILNDINHINAAKEVNTSIAKIIKESEGQQESFVDYDNPIQITFNDVSVQRGEFSLKDFNYTFESGKKYAIVGHSGSGKSTILSMIRGELLPDEGVISLNGKPIEEDSIKKIMSGIHQQDHIFYADYHKNCSLFDTYKPDYHKMERYFKKGFLNRVKNRKDCRELSGGEKQILLLMRSYASKKDIILLDEVFTSIDLVNREDARNFIFDMDAQLFISVTHDLSEENLRKYDEVLVMENGKLKKDKDFLRLGTVNV